MPIHIAPAIRAREEAEEAAGLIQKLDSLAVTNAKAAEAQGLVFKEAPIVTYLFGTSTNVIPYTPVIIKPKG